MSGVLWNGLGRILPVAVAMVATPFLLHRLGVDRWALFTLALSIVGSFGILDFGISAALTRALAERIGTPEETEAAPLVVATLFMLAVIGCGAATLGFLATPTVVDRMLNVPSDLRPEAVAEFRLVFLSAPLVVINSVFWGVLSAYQKWRAATLVSTPVNIMYWAGPVLAVLMHGNLAWIIATIVAARVAQGLMYGALSVRVLPGLATSGRIKLHLLRPLLRIGAWVTVGNMLWLLMLFVDRFIVGAVLSLAAVSYFATPVDLVNRLFVMTGAVAAAVFPAFAASHRSRPDRVHQLLRFGSLVLIIVILPACLLMAGLAHELLTLWLGSAFAAQSAAVLSVLAIGIFLNSVAALPATLTDSIGRPDAGALITLITTAGFLPLFVLMAMHYGVLGAAIAWSLRSLVYSTGRMLACSKMSVNVASVITSLFAIAGVSSAGLVSCILIGPLPERLTVIGVTMIVVVPMAAVMLLTKEDRLRCWWTIQGSPLNPALTRSARRT